MYIIKNALRNIMRSKGRNILIGCIALIIGLSACLALSIKEAAVSEKESGLEGISISANISVDRQSMMESFTQDSEPSEADRTEMKDQMRNMQSLSLSEMETYAKAESVKAFYYTNAVSFDSSEVEAVSTSTSTSTEDQDESERGFKGDMASQGDFRITGYSSYDAMTTFNDGTNTISSGAVFEEGSSEAECIIHQELATLNGIQIGDNITLQNPQNSEESFVVKVVGIYTSSESSESGFMNMAMMDPANQIYMSYEALAALVQTSSENSANDEEQTALTSMTSGTYVFENVEKYEAFEEEARALGLDDTYSISSSDVSAYERSLQPLENLSKYATYFLFVILIIGGVILVFLNIYRVRERKYEIGVLAAIGMNKGKVAMQFITEIFVTTLFAILIGAGIGAISSVPITNALLTTQSTQTSVVGMGEADGGNMGGKGGMPTAPGTNEGNSYIEEVSSATNVKVLVELVGIGILLTMLSGGVAVLTILRFEPLKILSNRE